MISLALALLVITIPSSHASIDLWAEAKQKVSQGLMKIDKMARNAEIAFLALERIYKDEYGEEAWENLVLEAGKDKPK